MIPSFNDFAFLQHQDFISRQDRRKTVRNDQARALGKDRLYRFLDGMLGDGVQRGSGFVEDDQPRFPEDDPRDRKPLLFAAGKLHAAVAHDGVVAFRQPADERVDIGFTASFLDFGLRGIGFGVEQILFDRAVEQVRVLRHHSDVLAQIGQIEFADVDAVQQDPSACHIIEARNQVDDGGLARSRRPDDGNGRSRLQFEADVIQDRLFRIIVEGNLFKNQLACKRLRLERLRIVVDFHRQIEILEDAVEKRHRTDHIDLDIQQGIDRSVHPAQERHHDGDVPDRQIRVAVFDDEDPADQIDQHRADVREDVDHDPEPFARHAFLDVQADHLFVGFLIAVELVVFRDEKLRKQLPADAEGFIQDLVDVVIVLPRSQSDFPTPFAHALRRQDEQRHHHDADCRQQRAFRVHRDERNRQRRKILQDARPSTRQHTLHAADIAGHAGDDVALLAGREEPVRHPLQMAVHLIAHIIGDVFRHPDIDIALHDTDQIGDDQHPEREADQTDQHRQVLLQQAFVDDAARQDCRKHAEYR